LERKIIEMKKRELDKIKEETKPNAILYINLNNGE